MQTLDSLAALKGMHVLIASWCAACQVPDCLAFGIIEGLLCFCVGLSSTRQAMASMLGHALALLRLQVDLAVGDAAVGVEGVHQDLDQLLRPALQRAT